MPAHVPIDDARQLWQENQQPTWANLLQVVEGHRNKTQGIANNVVLMLLPVIKRLEQSNTPYPSRFEDFVNVLNSGMLKEFSA